MILTHYRVLAICLIGFSLGAKEVTQEQQIIYPQDPHRVQKAGFDDPKLREQFITSMRKASRFVRAAAFGCGAAALGCLVLLVRAESMKRRAGSLAASLLFAALAIFLEKVGAMQIKMAASQEVVVADVSADAATAGVKLVGVADGAYIFSTPNCPPCKKLHKEVSQVQEKFPDLPIFEHEINGQDSPTQVVIQRMGINVLSTPLTVVVKGGMIARIIVGFLNFDDYVQKLGEALA